MTITREQIIAWAQEAGLIQEWMVLRDEDVARLERLVAIIEQHVRQDENEQCAKVCDGEASRALWNWENDIPGNKPFWNGGEQLANGCAIAIRARSAS